MTSAEIWQCAYLISLARGLSPPNAKDIANQAVKDWEEFEKDTT